MKIASVKKQLDTHLPYEVCCGITSGNEAINESIYLKHKLDELEKRLFKCY